MRVSIRRLFCWLVMVVAIGCSGCTGSRWARSDPVYAEKYPRHSDNVLQMAKQAVDARYVDDRSGISLAGNWGPDPSTAGGELTLFHYLEPWFEGRLGLVGLAGTGQKNLFGGVMAGARLQSPSRFAPFVGAGALVGWNEFGDDDGVSVQFGSEEEGHVAAFPEVGAHFWITPHMRLTSSAAYHVTTAGRDDDQWMFGVGLSFLHPGDYTPARHANYDTLSLAFPGIEVAKRPTREDASAPLQRLPRP